MEHIYQGGIQNIYKDEKGNLYDESCVGFEQTLGIEGDLKFSHSVEDLGY